MGSVSAPPIDSTSSGAGPGMSRSSGAFTEQEDVIQILRDDTVGVASMRILVVTRMWPTERYEFRSGFIAVQVDALRRAGVACDVLVAQGSRGFSAYAQIAKAVRRALRTQRYDLVHAHYGLTAAAAGLQRDCPLAVTFHGSDVMGDVDPAGRRTIRGRIERAISKVVARRANVAIAVSQRLADELPACDVHVVPVGIDETAFRPRERD